MALHRRIAVVNPYAVAPGLFDRLVHLADTYQIEVVKFSERLQQPVDMVFTGEADETTEPPTYTFFAIYEGQAQGEPLGPAVPLPQGMMTVVVQIEKAIRRYYLSPRASSVQDVQGGVWERSSEELIRLLYNLLDDRDTLTELLISVHGDLRAAQARIEVLEGNLMSLEAERFRTPEPQRNPKIIHAIALSIVAALGTVGGAVGSEAIKQPAQRVIQQAAKVQNDCNVVVNVQNAPQTQQGSAQLSATGTLMAGGSVTPPVPPSGPAKP